ncbi:hypothetical protein HK105_207003 [Polyrhizophydium stewartii]|uniref:Peptidase A1 domain-containing protein n=1 Tax=Polyrhizophydium stewartii TaxID=2732419 RepID=A0ABR4N202_9FUNG
MPETLRSRMAVGLNGGFSTCFLIDLDVDATKFRVMVDSGSTDLTLPTRGINNYAGPMLPLPRPPGATLFNVTYGDGSGWSGFNARGSVAVSGSTVRAADAPLVAIVQQTTNPVYTTGVDTQGLLGLAYAGLSSAAGSPATVVDAWVASGSMPANQIGFHACPYALANDSFIDFGNTDPPRACVAPGASPVTVWAPSPARSYFTVDLRGIDVAGIRVASQSVATTTVIDSCTNGLIVPAAAYEALISGILSSKALATSTTTQSVAAAALLAGSPVSPADLGVNWELLPTLSFEIASDEHDPADSSVFLGFTIVLGPRQYIQTDATGSLYQGTDAFIILGIPLFNNLFILLDRDAGRIGFGPGCGCAAGAVDAYPQIIAPRASGSNGTRSGSAADPMASVGPGVPSAARRAGGSGSAGLAVLVAAAGAVLLFAL